MRPAWRILRRDLIGSRSLPAVWPGKSRTPDAPEVDLTARQLGLRKKHVYACFFRKGLHPDATTVEPKTPARRPAPRSIQRPIAGYFRVRGSLRRTVEQL